MDRTADRINLIKTYMMERVCKRLEQNQEQSEFLPVFDDDCKHYSVLHFGWQGARHIHSIVVFARIKNEKIHIEEDITYEGIGNFLMDNGVPESEIVLGWLPDYQPMTKQEAA